MAADGMMPRPTDRPAEEREREDCLPGSAVRYVRGMCEEKLDASYCPIITKAPAGVRGDPERCLRCRVDPPAMCASELLCSNNYT